MLDQFNEQLHPPPPTHSKRFERPDFGTYIADPIATVINQFFCELNLLITSEYKDLANGIRSFNFFKNQRLQYNKLATNYLKNKKIDKSKTYDFILIGAGIHSAVFNYALKRLMPNINILTVESGSHICSTFHKMGEALILNSPTFSKVGLNSNIIPGHFVQLADFDDLIEKPFPNGKHIHEIATMIFFHADADILFNQRVDSISSKKSKNIIKCANEEFGAKHVILSNGMGEAKSWDLQDAELSKKIISGDQFISMTQRDTFFEDEVKDKKIAVVGDGDTANCVMEYLLPLNYPNNTYDFQEIKNNLPKLIFWVGQTADNIQDYFHKNKSRYCHSGGLIEFFWTGESPFELSTQVWKKIRKLITCVPEKLVSINEKKSLLEIATKSERIAVDLVINCTDRQNKLAEKLLKNQVDYIDDDITLYGGHWHPKYRQFIVAPRLIKNTKIAHKIRDKNIYIIGGASPVERIIPDSEAKDGALKYLDDRRSLTNSKWSMEHTLPRTEAFAKKMYRYLNNKEHLIE